MQNEIEKLLIGMQQKFEKRLSGSRSDVDFEYYRGYVEGIRHARHEITKMYENLF